MMDRLSPIGAIQEKHGMELLLKSNACALPPKYGNDQNSANYLQVQPVLTTVIQKAEIIVWDNQILKSAQTGHECFIDTFPQPDLFYGPAELWMLSHDQPLSEEFYEVLGLSGEWLVSSILLFREDVPKAKDTLAGAIAGMPEYIKTFAQELLDHGGKRFIAGSIFLCREEGYVAEDNLYWMNIPVGGLYPDQPINESWAPLIAGMQFMRSSIAKTTEFKPPRQFLRQAARKNEYVPPVKTVILRRFENLVRDKSMRETIEWTCQWFVRGHWRRLHEPRQSDGALMTYVQPYVKGPEDKPLRPPRESIYAVAR